MRKFIPYGKQIISEQDIAEVIKVLHSDLITQGPVLEAFEQALTQHVQCDYAIAVSSATAALHLACLALDVQPGDHVWTVPNTFVASANCARYCGATIDFVDIDSSTGNLSVAALKHKLASASTLPKVVIPVHFAGSSCDMEAVYELSTQYGFKIIEDASHAIGGKYQGKPVGNCKFSNICVFSFHPVKIITTGEGGALTTNNTDLAKRIKNLRSHGVTRDQSSFKEQSHGPWYYEQQVLGFNYRLTDIQAALGLSQLSKLNQFVKSRHALARMYHSRLNHVSQVKTLAIAPDVYSAYHLFVIRVPSQYRAHIFDKLRDANIGVNVHYIPVHTQPDYQDLGFESGDFPDSEQYYAEAITLPLHPSLRKEDVDYICDHLEQALYEVSA